MGKRKMLKVKWKRVLAGILCATLFLSEISIIDFHSHAAEAEPVVDNGELEKTETEIIEKEAVAGKPEEGQTEAEDSTSNEESKELADGENNENSDGQKDKEEGTEGKGTESGEVTPSEEQDKPDLGGTDTDSKEELDTDKDSIEEDSGKNGDSVPSVSENTESAEGEDVVVGVDNALTTSADDIASGIVDENYGHIEWVIDKNGKLTVSGWGDYATYFGEGVAPWYSYRDSIKSAEVNVSRMTVAARMFEDCTKMSSIDLTHFDSSSLDSTNSMFSECNSLKSIDLSGWDTRNMTNMTLMFEGCRSLKSLDLSSWDTRNVTSMGGMFFQCSGLNSIDLNGWDTGSVTEMGIMFDDCLCLNSIDLSVFDTRNVTNMNGMFSGCEALSNMDLSAWDTSNVTDMSWMFSGCEKLSSINLSGWDTGNVTNMNGMFKYCNRLDSIDLSSFDARNVTSMEEMFDGFLGNNILMTIYTPYNVNVTYKLPVASSSDIWYRSDGTTVTELPQNLNYSVALGRNYIPTEKENNIYIDEESNHKYQLFDTSMEWEKAKEHCEGLGGHLVTITSDKEQEFVTEIAKKSKKKNIWLGAEMVSGKFSWITGEKFEYTNWNRGEPNNDYNNEDTIMMYTYYGTNSDGYSITPGVWNDESKQGRDWANYTVDDMGFICEWDETENIPEYDFFNIFTYRADKLHDASLPEGETLEDWINMDTPSSILLTQKQSGGMENAAAAWEMLSLLFDSLDDVTSLYDFTVEEKDIYAAVILNALEVSTEYDVVDSCEAIIKDSKTYVSEINKWAKNRYKMDISEQKNFQNLSQKQKEELADEAEKLFKKNFDPDLQSLNKVFKNFDTILNYADNLETYLEKISANLAMANLSESMKIVLRTMYDNCPNSNMAMKLALSDCVTIIDSTTDQFIGEMLTEGFNIVGEEIAKYLVREYWDVLKKSLNAGFPALDVLLAGYKLGKYISNSFMNTDDTIEKYHKMSAVVSFEAVLDNTYRALSNQYMNSKSEKDASAYLSAIDLLFSFRDQDCVSAYGFVDTLDQATINQIADLFQGDGDNNYDKVKKSIRSIQGSYTTEYETCLTSWINYLDEDYPDEGLYEIYKHRLDDSYNRILKKKYVVACPVDVFVYDSDDNLVAYVENNKPHCNGNMTVAVLGEQKYLYFYDDNEYRIECVGNNDGAMDVEVSEFDNYENETRVVYFYDMNLEKDKKYETNVDGNQTGRVSYKFTDNTGKAIVPDFDTDTQAGDGEEYKLKVNSGNAVVNGEFKTESNLHANVTVEIRAFVADGYEFVGWVSDNATNIFKDATQQITTLCMPNTDVIVTAVIRDKDGNIITPSDQGDEKINVFFNVKNHGVAPSPYIGIEKGIKIEEPLAPVAEGYTFTGWFKEKDCINKWDFAIDMVQEDITLYAGWTENGAEKLYRVSFDTLNHGTAPDAYTDVKENSIIPEPEAPTAEGYRFIGWFKDNKCTVRWQFETDTVTSDITLYAGWVLDDDYGDVSDEDIPASGKIPSGLWIAEVGDYLYTGKPIKPEAHVYDSKTRLKKGQDYIITYKNNIKAGDASTFSKAPTIVVKGKGNYAGTETETFTIQHVSLNDPEIVCDSLTAAYTGKVQRKLPSISYRGKKLSNNKDFTVSYPDFLRGITEAYCAPGTYDILLTAKAGGNYAGVRTVKFTITKSILLSKASVKKIPDQPYTGRAVEPELTVTLQNTPLIKNTDYTVTYMNNKEAGKATVVLSGIGDYAGTKKVAFNIAGTSLKKAKVDKISVQTYNGLEQKPDVSLSVDGISLKNGTDYQITYANNLNAGTGTATIKGINAYTGSIKKTFRIDAYNLKEDTANRIGGLRAAITCKYLKGGSKPEIELTYAGKELTEGTDYTLSYKNNKALTTAGTGKLPTVTITGKGNFKGSISKSFTIVGKALDDKEFPVTLRAADKGFEDKPGNYISRPVLVDSDGKKLTAGKDYDKNVIYLREDETFLDKTDKLIIGEKVKVKVTGRGAYSGELEATYEMKPEDFSKAKITVVSQPYTGRNITLDKDDITVKLNGSHLRFGTDYEIIGGSYINNIKKGTAEVTIAGKGKYGGMKTVKFKIISKRFQWFWRLLQ